VVKDKMVKTFLNDNHITFKQHHCCVQIILAVHTPRGMSANKTGQTLRLQETDWTLLEYSLIL